MRNEFSEPLLQYWRVLSKNIHPDDASIAPEYFGVINFDHPPPAFVGDIGNADIFILMANGGFNARETAKEFSHPQSAEIFRNNLRTPAVANERWTSLYYTQKLGLVSDWLKSGRAAIVNALAYRSESITDPVRNFARRAPSAKFHRRWFDEHLRPAAAKGRVRVVVHRPGLWELNGETKPRDGIWILPNPHPARRLLSHQVTSWALGGTM